jgi:hypothetical protein
MAIVKKTQQQIIAENEKISDQILEDLRSKGGDNMDGEKRANEKLMAGANGTINISKYKKWKKLYESGGNMRKAGIILNPAESKAFLKLYKKGN